MKKYEICIKSKNSKFESVQIKSPEHASEVIRQFYKDDINLYESFFILLLDHSLKTTGFAKISQGGVTGTVVDSKIVLKYIVDTLSSNVIIAHNHPSGNLKPSEQDINMTNKLKNTIELVQSNLQDHIILTDEGYYSFKNEGLL